MHDPKPAALYYLKLTSQAHPLPYIKGLAARHSYNFSDLSSSRDSPFQVAGSIFRQEHKVAVAARKQSRLIQNLVENPLKTARLLAAEATENRGKPSKPTSKRRFSGFPNSEISIKPSPNRLKPRGLSLHSRRLTRLDSLIAVCKAENTGNSLYKQHLTSERDSSEQRFRSFKGTLETVEGLGEHKPTVLARLYTNQVNQEQENHVDSYIFRHFA